MKEYSFSKRNANDLVARMRWALLDSWVCCVKWCVAAWDGWRGRDQRAGRPVWLTDGQTDGAVSDVCSVSQTALHWAAKQGRLETVDMMARAGVDVNLRSVRELTAAATRPKALHLYWHSNTHTHPRGLGVDIHIAFFQTAPHHLHYKHKPNNFSHEMETKDIYIIGTVSATPCINYSTMFSAKKRAFISCAFVLTAYYILFILNQH